MPKREFRFPGLATVGNMPAYFILAIALVVMCVAFAILVPTFATGGNILNVLRQSSSLFMLACGQTLIIVLAGIDLSQGSLVGLVSVITAIALVRFGIAGGILVGLVTGAASGLIQGLIVTKAKMQPFIVSLGMLFTIFGITFLITEGNPIFDLPESFRFVGAGMLGPIPLPVILFALVALVFHYLLRQTSLGRNVYAIGACPCTIFSSPNLLIVRIVFDNCSISPSTITEQSFGTC